jgi:four helix bundle protein
VGDYRKLIVWQFSSAVADRIRAVVARLPVDEQRRFSDQACRAADSIPLNIAEGCGLNTDRQLARHLTIALGSANELQDIIDAFERRGQLDPSDLDLPAVISRIRAMLAGLHKRVATANPERTAHSGRR